MFAPVEGNSWLGLVESVVLRVESVVQSLYRVVGMEEIPRLDACRALAGFENEEECIESGDNVWQRISKNMGF